MKGMKIAFEDPYCIANANDANKDIKENIRREKENKIQSNERQ